MRFRNATSPTEDELRSWATEPDADVPLQDWDLILSWQMEPGLLRLCIEFASDPICPNAEYFLFVLYSWVAVVARGREFELRRTIYDKWLDVVRGTKDAKIKKWRREARLIFQGQKPFVSDQWWSMRSAEQSETSESNSHKE